MVDGAPVMIRCWCCGTEVGFGSLATPLEIDLGVCSACPLTDAARAALTQGLEAGRAGRGANPHDTGSLAERSWSRGFQAARRASEAA